MIKISNARDWLIVEAQLSALISRVNIAYRRNHNPVPYEVDVKSPLYQELIANTTKLSDISTRVFELAGEDSWNRNTWNRRRNKLIKEINELVEELEQRLTLHLMQVC